MGIGVVGVGCAAHGVMTLWVDQVGLAAFDAAATFACAWTSITHWREAVTMTKAVKVRARG